MKTTNYTESKTTCKMIQQQIRIRDLPKHHLFCDGAKALLSKNQEKQLSKKSGEAAKATEKDAPEARKARQIASHKPFPLADEPPLRANSPDLGIRY